MKFFHLPFVTLSLLALSACPPVQHAPDPSPPRESCTPGIVYCDGNIAKTCGDRGYVVDRESCGNSAVCVSGACDVNVVCQPGQAICVRDTLKTCAGDGSGFAAEQECSGVCANGACHNDGGCPPEAIYCDGNAVVQCASDGSGPIGNPVDCGSALCVDGACADSVCDAGRATCQGEIAQTCNALGTGYSQQETCAPPSTCLDGRCQTPICTPGTSCQGSTRVTCNEQGTQITEQQDCAPGRCVDGRCQQADAGNRDTSAPPDNAAPDRESPDLATPDAATPDRSSLDSARPDRAGPDTSGSNCNTQGCTALPSRPYCDIASGLCVECASHQDCARRELCTDGSCQQQSCQSDSACPNGTYCNPHIGRCAQLPSDACTTNDECNPWGLTDDICDPFTRTCIPSCSSGSVICFNLSFRFWCIDTGCYECVNNGNCPGTACDTFDQMCVRCQSDSDCLNASWHCDSGNGSCYECLNDSHCPGQQRCEPDSHICVDCLDNNDCANPSYPECGKSFTCLPPCSDECSANGDIRCTPDDVTPPISKQKCGDHDDDHCLEWSTLTYYSCGSHMSCEPSSDTCVCLDECSSGQQVCDGSNNRLSCTQDSNHCWYMKSISCPSYAHCAGGGTNCVCDVQCTIGAQRCVAGQAGVFEQCADGVGGCSYWSQRNCQGNTACTEAGGSICQ